MAKQSDGLLMYRTRGCVEVFLVHPGGPFWARTSPGRLLRSNRSGKPAARSFTPGPSRATAIPPRSGATRSRWNGRPAPTDANSDSFMRNLSS